MLEEPSVHATSALYRRAGPVTFANCGKSNQKRLLLHPASSSGARNGRDASTSHECFAVATQSVCRRRIYDRPLLRSSARAEGAFDLKNEVFVMSARIAAQANYTSECVGVVLTLASSISDAINLALPCCDGCLRGGVILSRTSSSIRFRSASMSDCKR